MEHEDARIVCAPLVLDRCGDILRERRSAGGVLRRPPSFARFRGRKSQSCIAGFAKPAEIIGLVVALIAVDVIDDEEAC